MIVSQLALCEECRDGTCATCKAFLRKQAAKRRTVKRLAREVAAKCVPRAETGER